MVLTENRDEELSHAVDPDLYKVLTSEEISFTQKIEAATTAISSTLSSEACCTNEKSGFDSCSHRFQHGFVALAIVSSIAGAVERDKLEDTLDYL